MVDRITQRDLEKCAERLNELTGKDYVIGGAYGGVSLEVDAKEVHS